MENILNPQQLSTLCQMIAAAQRITICAHVNPDGDAVGSALAMRHYLERKGKEVDIVMPSCFPDFLRWMPGAHGIVVYSRNEAMARAIVQRTDLFLIIDLNTPDRLKALGEAVLQSSVPRIMIDHHTAPQDFCKLTISQPHMCATAEVWCHLLAQMGELQHITTPEATCLYAALMCDTGAFTYGSSRPVVFEIVADLLRRGIDKDRIYHEVFWSASAQRLRLMGYLIHAKMELLYHQRVSIITLNNDERRLFNSKNGDTEGVVNMPLQIKGMRLSIFLAEDTEHAGLVKVSLRSVGDFPCNQMAAQCFNGGGHEKASGGSLQGGMAEAVKGVKKALQAYEQYLQ